MSQKGRESVPLMSPAELLKVPPAWRKSQTFLSTNNMKDTLKFQSGSASYFLEDEYLMVKGCQLHPVADALIQPGGGILYVEKGARIRPTENAVVAVNNRHLIHSARLNIESSADYSGSGKYDYISEDGSSQLIEFTEYKG